MLPSIVESEMQEAVRRFLRTTFPMATPGFRRDDGSTLLDELLDAPGGLFKGPYLTLALPFRQTEAGETLPFERVQMNFAPYRHQMRAFSRLCGDTPLSTLVATGTGSGKTECFSLPILEDSARRRERGIKAIIIYPMNALATDQARRLAREIHRQPGLRGRVSVGLYVGDTSHGTGKVMTEDSVITCRDTLRAYPPDILLTNYKMLDFLLMRPADQPLWQHDNPGCLRYLVVDELHTFDGAQGTDLACLVRRLRQRLGLGDALACVGTSATIGGPASAQALRDYAAQVFATTFDEAAVIQEDRLTPEEFLAGAEVVHTQWPQGGVGQGMAHAQRAVDYVQAQALLWFGEAAPPLDAPDPAEALQARFALGECLRGCAPFREMLQAAHQMVDVESVLARWAARFRIDRGQARQWLDSLLALTAWARRPQSPDQGAALPLVNLRLQSWLRELSRLVASVAPRPVLQFADDLTDLTRPLCLPVVHCRECHAAGWLSLRHPSESRLESDLQTLYRGYFGHHPDVCLLFPLVEPPQGATQGLLGLVCADCGQWHGRNATVVACPGCGGDHRVPVWTPDMRREQGRGEARRLGSHHDCPFCGAVQGLSLMGSRAASLSSVLIGQLFASSHNDHRKLIAFSDSVQDAAHRAGFFGARTYSTLVRGAIGRFIQMQGNGMSLSLVAAGMPRFWRSLAGSDGAFVGTFIAPNMEWLRDYDELRTRGRLPAGSDLPALVEQRLIWEVLQGFGLRARIGRTLERTLTAAVAVDGRRLLETATSLAARLGEEVGPLRGVTAASVQGFLLGLLWRFRVRGAFYHPMLDHYIQSRGKTYALYRTPHMPNYGGAARPPALLTLGPVSGSFEDLLRQSWYLAWFNKTLATGDRVLASAEYRQVMGRVMAALTQDGLLLERTVSGASVWGLNTDPWRCTTTVTELVCDACGHRLQVPLESVASWLGLPCLHAHCAGTLAPSVGAPTLPGGHLPAHPVRLVPSEHSALLGPAQRLAVEQSFIHGETPWDINLLSATPTLEMGIDIGDLSTVLLCSVPPGQANYLQRIGRAGRRDGNALAVTVANAHPHDLYFYADPLALIQGEIRPPGVFLQATAVLERQLIAYGFDRWAASGVAAEAMPATLKGVLDGVEVQADDRFPLVFLRWVEHHREDLLRDFLALFPTLPEAARDHLGQFLLGGEHVGGMAHRVINRLQQLVQERKSLVARINRLMAQKKHLEALPRDEAVTAELEGVMAERKALSTLRQRLQETMTLNFFTDEGLLPNYAFPEEGVTLRTVILRRLTSAQREQAQGGKSYEREPMQFQRPAQVALSELAPTSRFYAVARRVEIDQVDLSVSEVQSWRLCDRCHYMENLAISGDPYRVCPRCGSPQWSDAGRRRNLLRLRQVFATVDDRSSRIGDDTDQRTPVFFNRQMLIDVPPNGATHAYRIASDQMPFGFEYLPRVTLREVNFGPHGAEDQQFAVAGDMASRPGFQLCRHCGKVRRRAGAGRPGQQHAYDCRLRRPGAVEQETDFFDSLYLFRELESEAVRIVLPLAEVGSSGQRLHSLIAALNLGLRRYFQGNVDHIQVAHQSEPTGGETRKHYLVLYDSVPGGTGYLKELLRAPDSLLQVLRAAHEVIHHCPCRHDSHRDGCYACLLAYRESRRMNEISRRAADEILGRILAQAHALERIDSLGGVTLNALLESELEQRFVDALGNTPGVSLSPRMVNGKPGYFVTVARQPGSAQAGAWTLEPQPRLGPADGVALETRPDFIFWPVRQSGRIQPVVIYTDGFQYHHDRMADDTAKRQAILDTGRFRLWTFGWHVLPASGQRLLRPAANLLGAGQQPVMQGIFDGLSAAGGWQRHGAYQSVVEGGSFAWLLMYLAGEGEDRERLRLAALSRALGWLTPASVRDRACRAHLLAHLRPCLPGALLACWDEDPSTAPAVLGASLTGSEPAVTGICTGVRLPLSALQAAQTGAVGPLQTELVGVHGLDDRLRVQDKDWERCWITYWEAANLLQFLPRLHLTCASGVQAGVYPDRVAVSSSPAPDQPAADWAPLIQQSLLGTALQRLAQRDLPLPEVGLELLDDRGEVLPELELAWPMDRVGVMLDGDEADLDRWRAMGWTVLVGLDDPVADRLVEHLSQGTKR
ncbi:DEAD/DEAH box helicase domain-containing protein [Ectothiorhodospira magna]|uniref:DEAD/DEAH box helicase domain-containing protein n=1 Tax=Ectothiorhodospira magna TaxID=867345 RepID=A0A1H8YVU3_9GAMM|nr:DEAD/DEAH box helicase [Ectothiorhodospira magna]SEP56246.1 DEAD/DEAH box helicase domain-containing protein [Ectothiorhodospira magna]